MLRNLLHHRTTFLLFIKASYAFPQCISETNKQHNTHNKMSTAGRATFQAIKGTGQSSVIKTASVSGKDQTAHTKLKYRQIGQASVEEIKQQKKERENLKNELQSKELKNILGNSKDTKWMVAQEEEKKVNVEEILQETQIKQTNHNFEEIKQKYDDADIDFDSVSSDAKDSDREDDSDEEGGNKRKGDDDFDSR